MFLFGFFLFFLFFYEGGGGTDDKKGRKCNGVKRVKGLRGEGEDE